MERSSRRLRRIGLKCLALAVGTAVVALPVAQYFHLGVAPALTPTLGVPTLYLAWTTFRVARTENAQSLSLAVIANQLAIAVGRQWEAEAQVRRMNDPHPLPVSWEALESGLVDDWSYLVAAAHRWPGADPSGWAADPSGLVGSEGELAQVLARVPTGRLVVLGEPGAGKTLLLVRLVLDLLARRKAGDPVPVLVSLASWNPAEQDLHTWLVGQLARDYPSLTEPATPGTGSISRARALVDDRLLLPILDGLDEIPEAVRGHALDRINATLRTGDRLVVSSRAEDYHQALHPPAGVPVKLQAAAGVLLRDLDTTAVDAYLRRDAGESSSPAAARWDPVLAALGTATAVGHALRTPLMVSLAHTTYNPRPGEHLGSLPDPAELCDTSRFPTSLHIEEHLFDAVIPAAYRPHPDPARRCRWSAQQAQRWLAFLARHLERNLHGTADLALWQLAKCSIKPAKGLRWSVVLFRMLGPVFGLVVGLVFGLMFTPVVGLVVGSVAGSVAGSVVGWVAAGLRIVPPDLTVATDPGAVLARDRRTYQTLGLMVGLMAGLMTGLMTGVGLGMRLGVRAWPGAGGMAWPVFGLVVGLMGGLVFGVVFGLVFGVVFGPVFGLVVGLAAGLVFLLVDRLPGGPAWGGFAIARCWLALRGKLPWRLMGFLADAHQQRGVLRQVGAVYQFRHIQLQRRLATVRLAD